MSRHALPLRQLAIEIKRDGFQMSTHALPSKREGVCARLKVSLFISLARWRKVRACVLV